jgi:hypothetical protein
MSETPIHSLPLLSAAQAQKEITINEALAILDLLVGLSVKDRGLTAPPGSPAEGDRYIVPASPTGAWVGWENDVAAWSGGAWLRLPARRGLTAWVEDEAILTVWNGTAWVAV